LALGREVGHDRLRTAITSSAGINETGFWYA